jgi:hypothetical protein
LLSGQSGILFIARHDHDNVHRLQLTGGVKCLQRLNDDDVAAFHVDDARPARRACVDALELLEGTVRLEHGVEMSDEQNPRSGSRMIGDEMSAAFDLVLIHPLRLESESVELGAKDRPHLPHTRKVVRAAVDVDDALEQRETFIVVSVDRFHERAIGGGESKHRRGEQRRNQSSSEDHRSIMVGTSSIVVSRRFGSRNPFTYFNDDAVVYFSAKPRSTAAFNRSLFV